jgi:hypothetical protein
MNGPQFLWSELKKHYNPRQALLLEVFTLIWLAAFGRAQMVFSPLHAVARKVDAISTCLATPLPCATWVYLDA